MAMLDDYKYGARIRFTIQLFGESSWSVERYIDMFAHDCLKERIHINCEYIVKQAIDKAFEE